MAWRSTASTMLVTAALVTGIDAIDLDVTPQDVERALAIARGQERERAVFHAPYVRVLTIAAVERVEIVSEFRRIVLTAEERARKGDRAFVYSATQAQQANAPWKGRLSIIARVRFHPQNAYVAVPAADIVIDGRPADAIGALREPILSLPSPQRGESAAILGAIVESVFDAATVGQGVREFIVRLEGRELTRVAFDLGALQ